MYSYYVLLVYVSILCVKKYLLNLYARSKIMCLNRCVCMSIHYYIPAL